MNDITMDFSYKPDMNVVRSARSFIKSLCEVYGNDRGLAVWDHIRSGLGDDIAGDIFLGMLVRQEDIRVSGIGDRFIDAIKEVRWLTGWGLKEAKDFCDNVRLNGPQIINVEHMDEQKVEQFANNMKKIGCTVT